MIDAIATILNEAISLGVQTPIGWAQLINGKPYEYKGAGQWAPIAEDTAGAWSYMRLNGQVNVTGAQVDGIACGAIAAQIPIRYAAMLPREDCDSLVGVLIGTVAAIRATDKRIRTEIGAIKADFTSVRFGIDEAFAQEFGGKAKKPLDKVFVTLDILLTVSGTEACLRTECGPIVIAPCGDTTPTTVNGVQSNTPTIVVRQGGEPVGTLDPITGIVTIPECPPSGDCPMTVNITVDGVSQDPVENVDPCVDNTFNINITYS
jgi:hypothetical protein